MKTFIFGAGILGALLFAIASIWGGAQIEGYSFLSQYISESFSSGLPNTGYLRIMYVISGILLFVFGVSAASFLPKSKGFKFGFFAFAFFYGLGTIIVSVFPCDLGCPTDINTSSIAQLIHNFSAFLTYILAPFCLLSIGFSARKMKDATRFSKVSIICGILAFGFVVLLFGNPTGPFIGLFQRIIEGSILFWVIYTSFYIRRINNN